MVEKEAMRILCRGRNVHGKIDDVHIIVFPRDIQSNLESNDYELNLEFSQDLTWEDKDYNYNIFQGHSLSEVELENEE